MLRATALWHVDASHSELREAALPAPVAPDLLELNSLYSMISTGTERLVASSGVAPSFAAHMSVPYMDGCFSLPIKYGYSLIGRQGDTTYHVMHPHQDRVQVATSDAFALQPETPPRRAALLSNMETVVNAIWDARLQVGDRVAVLGFGNIGALLSLTLEEHANCTCDVVEPGHWRRERAGELGWATHEALAEEYDVIFNTTCVPVAAQAALDHLALEGRLIELSWYGDQQVPLQLGHAFHYRRLRIISSQVSHIPKHRQETMNYRNRKQLCETLLRSERYDALIADPVPFQQLPAWFDDLRNGRLRNGPIWIIDYSTPCTR